MPAKAADLGDANRAAALVFVLRGDRAESNSLRDRFRHAARERRRGNRKSLIFTLGAKIGGLPDEEFVAGLIAVDEAHDQPAGPFDDEHIFGAEGERMDPAKYSGGGYILEAANLPGPH